MTDQSLMKHWVPACTRAQLDAGKPIGVCLYGRDVVIWRTASAVAAGDDLCSHHGAKLSLGKVCNNRLRCPYHGWEYDETGVCTRIPAEPRTRIPKYARINTMYATVEYGDLIWVHPNQPDGLKPPSLPHYEDPEYSVLSAGPYEVKTSFARMCDNFIDATHVPFVHEGTIGLPELPEVPTFELSEVDGLPAANAVLINVPDRKEVGAARLARFSFRVLSPLCAYYEVQDAASGGKASHALMLAVQPNDEETCTVFFSSVLREAADPALHTRRLEFELAVFRQDIAVLESVRPKKLPLYPRSEIHLRSDAMSIAYRRYLQRVGVSYGTLQSKPAELNATGWAVRDESGSAG